VGVCQVERPGAALDAFPGEQQGDEVRQRVARIDRGRVALAFVEAVDADAFGVAPVQNAVFVVGPAFVIDEAEVGDPQADFEAIGHVVLDDAIENTRKGAGCGKRCQKCEH